MPTTDLGIPYGDLSSAPDGASQLGAAAEFIDGLIEAAQARLTALENVKGTIIARQSAGADLTAEIPALTGEQTSSTQFTDSPYMASGAVTFTAGRRYKISFSGTLRSDGSNPRCGLVKFQAATSTQEAASVQPQSEFRSGYATGSGSYIYDCPSTVTVAAGVRCTLISPSGNVKILKASWSVLDCGESP